MNPEQAIRVLIEHTHWLTPEVKASWLQQIPNLSPAQQQQLGKLLAQHKKLSLQLAQDITQHTEISQFLDQLEKQISHLNKEN